MTVAAEILATYRDPSAPMRRMLAEGPREDRALIILTPAAVLLFVARTPFLARAAALDPSVPLDARLGITLFVMLFMLPLLAYGLAYLIHLILRAFGATGAAYGARLALFWGLLAIAPAMLVQGLLEGLIGPTAAVRGFGVAVFVLFLWFVGRGLSAGYQRGAVKT